MTSDELKHIGEKIAKGEADPKEILQFLEALNAMIDGMRKDLAEIKHK